MVLYLNKQLENLNSIEDVQKNLINPIEYLDYPVYELNQEEMERISHGMSIKLEMKDNTIVLIHNNKIAAVAIISNKIAKVSKVFI